MWLYFLLMFFLAIFSCKSGRSKRKLLLSGLILTSLLGFKDATIGNDTPNYIELFNRLKHMTSFIDETTRYEKGYQIYNKIIGMLFDSPQDLFIITAIICMGCICFGIKKNSINWQYSLFLFVGLRFYYFFLSGLRQSIAVSLIFVAYYFLKKEKIVPYIGIIMLACTFHFSAFIFLFAWPVSKMKLERLAIAKVLILTIITYLFFNPLLRFALGYLPAYYSHYLVTEAASTNNLANFINAAIPCLVIIFAKLVGYYHSNNVSSYNLSKVNNKSNCSFYYSDINTQLLFLIIAAGLSIIATRASILDRMVQYYWIFSIITIPNILFSIEDDRTRTAWYLIITSLVIVYNLTILALRPEWNAIIPYKFFVR